MPYDPVIPLLDMKLRKTCTGEPEDVYKNIHNTTEKLKY